MGTRAEGRLSWCYCWGRQCWKGGHSATLSCDHCLQQSWGSVRLWATLGRCRITHPSPAAQAVAWGTCPPSLILPLQLILPNPTGGCHCLLAPRALMV